MSSVSGGGECARGVTREEGGSAQLSAHVNTAWTTCNTFRSVREHMRSEREGGREGDLIRKQCLALAVSQPLFPVYYK